MKERAAGLVVADGRVLLIRRRKGGREYCTVPGGGIEPGESPEAACHREMREETSLLVQLGPRRWTITNGSRTEHYFEITAFSGNPELAGPERQRNTPENSYELVWVPIAELNDHRLEPAAVKAMLEEIATYT